MVHSLANVNTLLQLYEVTYKIRMVELRIAEEYPHGEMRCPVHLSVGQELASAVFSLFQSPIDYAVSTHRAHAHYIAKGGNIDKMIAELYGKATGCSLGRGGSMHLSDPEVLFMGSSAIVGNSIPVGVGIAYGLKIRQREGRVYVFLGDAATEEGVFFESLNFASLHQIPITFICENNKYSVYSRIENRQPTTRSISDLARAFGVDSYFIEFGNIDETFNVFSTAVSEEFRLRPQFIEIETYRWLEHCGPNYDDNLEYRTAEELEKYLKFDLLAELRKQILKVDGRGMTLLSHCEKKIRDDISHAFEFAKNSPFPDISIAVGDFEDVVNTH